jgi:acetyl-CoA carboxylase, biotin carboxylase subunit
MFKKVLIANRGEIALRIIRACKELGVMSVAVFSTADKNSLHVRFADQAICIGPPDARRSYLNIPNIIAAAQIAGVDAIHPGYGFMAENAYFADICDECGIKFIGPTAEVIRLMGDKSKAKETMRKVGIPVVPGVEERFTKDSQWLDAAQQIGYPVILKAAAGGGGKGMRVIEHPDYLLKGLRQASSEAASAFGNDQVYIEKYLMPSRHIEFQILGDELGNIIHLGERDCSIQRRHQKLIEESPSPALNKKLRASIGENAILAAKTVGYVNAGTVEFIMTKDEQFYFIEMNTRIQVEHPVTEEISGINLVKEQIRIAAGLKLRHQASLNKAFGHAIECRINAEDPITFSPMPGKIETCNLPGGLGVRVDSVIYPGYIVQPFYDSMLAKLIVHAEDRDEALARMSRALDEFVIEGISTTLPFHKLIINDPVFRRGAYDTSFLLNRSRRHI